MAARRRPIHHGISEGRRVGRLLGRVATLVLSVSLCATVIDTFSNFMSLRHRQQATFVPWTSPLAALRPRQVRTSSARAAAEDDDQFSEAKMEMEAAKFRLEAARLRAELEEFQRERGLSSATSPSAPTAQGSTAASPVPVVTEQVNVQPATAATPASASGSAPIVESSTLRRAADLLLRLRRATPPGGQAALEAFVLRLIDTLEYAGRARDKQDRQDVPGVDAVVGDAEIWSSLGVSVNDAQRAFLAAAQLLTPRGSPKKELLKGVPGDRDVVLQMLVHDQLPEEFSSYAPIVEMQDRNRENPIDDSGQNVEIMDPSLMAELGPKEIEAVRFHLRLEKMPSEEARNQARFQRLREFALARDALQIGAGDPELLELASATEAWHLPLYTAMRSAQLRARPEDEVRNDKVSVIALEINFVQIVGGLVVLIALAYFAAAGVNGSISNPEFNGDTQAPMYSLKDSRVGGAGAKLQ